MELKKATTSGMFTAMKGLTDRTGTIQLLQDVYLPKMLTVEQRFPRPFLAVEEISTCIRKQLLLPDISKRIRPGMRIAVTAGSRGVANAALILKTILNTVKELGGDPFIVPAMGSHGGATPSGQKAILASYGITENTMGFPILSSMEVVPVGTTESGEEVFIAKDAADADGIIVNCRIKPHTSFRGPYESGIMKMMTIGLGKQIGAETCHRQGFKHMAELVPAFGRVILKNSPILFAVACIENAFDETAEIHVVPAEKVETQEPILLARAKENIPSIMTDSCDVLIVDRIGKDISGSGMDPNVTGVPCTPYVSGGMNSQNVVVLDITDASHGNPGGLGLAQVTTHRAIEKLNLDAMYLNALTFKLLSSCEIPLFMESDRDAIRLALKGCLDIDEQNPRIIRIQDSLHVDRIQISEAYLKELAANPHWMLVSEPSEMAFDNEGNLLPIV